MSVFLISDNLFFYEGVRAIVEDNFGIPVQLITIDFLINYCRFEAIKKDDLFIVATNALGEGMSALIALDFYSANIIYLNGNGNFSKTRGHFSWNFLEIARTEGIIALVNNYALLKRPKMWSLTYSETVVLSYRLRGFSAQRVNSLLSINVKTVYSHQRTGLAKMGAKSFANLYRLSTKWSCR